MPVAELKKTSIYLDADLDAALARRAAEDGTTKAELIRTTLAGAVDRPRRPRIHVGALPRTPEHATA